MGHDPIPTIGVIITNRDRTATLRPCLRSLAGQSRPPRWVAIADLGSECSQAVALERLAQDFGVSYLRLEDPGQWIKGRAFNTALRRMPGVPFILQLDADVVVHPHLIELSERALTQVDGVAYVASYADEMDPTYDGSVTAYASLLAKARCVSRWAFGGSYLLPRSWLLSARGMDESYRGWGFADGDLWHRARRKLRAYEELTGSFAVHQPHARQPGASVYRGNPNWQRYLDRRDGLQTIVNRDGFGSAPLVRAVKRRVTSVPIGERKSLGIGAGQRHGASVPT